MVGSPSVQQLQQNQISFSPTQAPVFGGNGVTSPTGATLENNVKIYYTNFHPAFPLLPYDSLF